MPSMMPFLYYDVPVEDKDCCTSSSSVLKESSESAPSPTPRIAESAETESRVKSTRVGANTEMSAKVTKKTGKQHRRKASKAAPRKESPSTNGNNERVDHTVWRVAAHSKSVRAVKKAVLEIQLFLLDGVKDKEQLLRTGLHLTQGEYSDVVTERSISKQCGYPLCQEVLVEDQKRKGNYRISLREHKVYDIREMRLFCTASCLVASKTFQSSLQIERDGLMDKEKIITAIRHIRDHEASKLEHDVENIKDPQGGKALLKDATVSEVRERQETKISSFDDPDPFDAIEGYIPRKSGRVLRPYNVAEQSGGFARGSLFTEADLERIASGNRPIDRLQSRSRTIHSDTDELPLIQEKIKELEVPPSTGLKSAMKKGETGPILRRSVSWMDQQRKGSKSERKDKRSDRKDQRSSPRLKDALETGIHTLQTADQTSPSSVPVNSSGNQVDSAEGEGEPAVPVADVETRDSEEPVRVESLAVAVTEAVVIKEEVSIGAVEKDARESTPIVLGIEDLCDLKVTPASSSATVAVTDIRWPTLEPEEEDDLEITTAREAWHDSPPKNFKVEISMFGTIWMALDEWISAATIAYIYGQEPKDQEDFVIANGKEFRRQVVHGDGLSGEISKTFSTCISRVFSEVVEALHLNVPVSTLEQSIGRLVRTMSFVEALPPLATRHWRMVLTLLLDSLSVERLPSIRGNLSNLSLVHKCIAPSGTSEDEYDALRSLVLPFGRLPIVPIKSGG